MARSPKYVPPPGMEGKALGGMRPCGCVTAALSMGGPEEWSRATEKDGRDFYADMARSSREVRWMDADELRSSLTMNCPHRPDGGPMSDRDRTVHATLAGGDLLIRLNRAGKWFRESEGRRFPITFGLAVDLATQPGCTPHLDLPGGARFDAAVREQTNALNQQEVNDG